MYLAKSFYTKMGDYGEFFLIVANLKRFCIFLLKFALMGTSPLTRLRALPAPVLAGWQEKGAVAPFSAKQDYP